MATRYDDWIVFYNASELPFVGRWELEEYPFEPKQKDIYPAWLCRHFAKRLADQEMIRRFGKPITDNDKERTDFISLCLGETKQTFLEGPSSFKEQMNEDRKKLRPPTESEMIKARAAAEKQAAKELSDESKKEAEAIKQGSIDRKPQLKAEEEAEGEVEKPEFVGSAGAADSSLQSRIPKE